MKSIRILLILNLVMNPFIKETKLQEQTLHLARVEYVKGFPSDEAGIEKGVSA